MADINNLVPFILKWEGGYVDDPGDLGGPTQMGVTLKVWQDAGYDKNGDGAIDEEDLKMIFRQDLIECVLRPHYWDRWQADRIRNQSVANLLVDWVWASGAAGVTIPQRMLNLKPDGIVGEKTLAAVNGYPDQKELFERIKAEREAYIERICLARPANLRYRKGWLNRLNDIRFGWIVLLCLLPLWFSACKPASQTESARMETKAFAASDAVSDRQVKTRSDAALSRHTGSEEDTETRVETVTVLFDTADSNLLSPDSSARRHPVKELSKTRVIRRKVTRSSTQQEAGVHRSDSTIAYSRETTGKERMETVATQKSKTFRPRYRLYAILFFLIAAVAAGWIVRKKTAAFFAPFQKNSRDFRT